MDRQWPQNRAVNSVRFGCGYQGLNHIYIIFIGNGWLSLFVCLLGWLIFEQINLFHPFFNLFFSPATMRQHQKFSGSRRRRFITMGSNFQWHFANGVYRYYIYILCIMWFTFQSFSIITYLTCFFFSKNISLHLGEQVDTNVSSMGGPSTNQSGSNKIISENHQR